MCTHACVCTRVKLPQQGRWLWLPELTHGVVILILGSSQPANPEKGETTKPLS